MYTCTCTVQCVDEMERRPDRLDSVMRSLRYIVGVPTPTLSEYVVREGEM